MLKLVDTFYLAAVGCSNLIPPDDAWIKREDDKIIIGCYTSRQTWQLRCHDGRWTGVVSNCSRGLYCKNTVSQLALNICRLFVVFVKLSIEALAGQIGNVCYLYTAYALAKYRSLCK